MYCLLKMGIFHCYVSLPKGSIKSSKAAFPTLPNMFVNITFLASNKGLTQASAKEHQFRKQTRHRNTVRGPAGGPIWDSQFADRSMLDVKKETKQIPYRRSCEFWNSKSYCTPSPPPKKKQKKQESNGMTARGLSLGMSSQTKNVRCLVGNSVWALSIIFDQSLAGRWNRT